MPVNQTPWIERTFRFDFPTGMMPIILGRLSGASARLESIFAGQSHQRATRNPSHGWSAQQHAGHLLDLDDLHEKRLDEFLAGVEVLTAADMQNRATESANHNEHDLKEILASFKTRRHAFVKRMDALDEKMVARTALHPRLQQPMRLIDMAFFTAEHDDHHIAIIQRLLTE